MILPVVSGVKLSTGDNGSHPGNKTKIIGFSLSESAKHLFISNDGTWINSSPICLVTKSLIAKIILSGRTILSTTNLSNSLKIKRSGDGMKKISRKQRPNSKQKYTVEVFSYCYSNYLE